MQDGRINYEELCVMMRSGTTSNKENFIPVQGGTEYY